MLEKIKVIPIAAESLGVRSMCTLVETPDIRILLDAGVSLCPNRFSLIPHPIEFQTINQIRKQIEKIAKNVEIVTISHYHFDHHTPSHQDWLVNWTDNDLTAKKIYDGKQILVKDPNKNITKRQQQRAKNFQKTSSKYAKKIAVADEKTFNFGKSTILQFSKAVSHGPEDNSLGWIIMVTIKFKDEQFMFAPDVQGPMSNHTLKLILSSNPQVILLGGPPFYLSNHKVDFSKIRSGLINLEKIVKKVPITILEHHALRDKNWRKKTKKLFNIANKNGHKIITAAEFLSTENKLLEANRKELYQRFPPSIEFRQWIQHVLSRKTSIKPPI